jgi:serine/threonine protein kinase
VRAWLFQLLSALGHMHAHELWHRDVKLENILLDAAGGLRLADLGMTRIASLPALSSADANATALVCSLWTRAWGELLDRTRALS